LDQWYRNDPIDDDPAGDEATPVDVTSGDATNINFTLTMGHPPAKNISGRVTDASSGMGIPDVWVVVADAYDNNVGGAGTDGNGNYSVGGLPPGSCKVRTMTNQGYINEWYRNDPIDDDPAGDEATPVDVTSGDAIGIDFTLTMGHPPGQSISGRVTDASSGTGLGWLLVVVTDAYGMKLGFGAVTDPGGHYLLAGLPPGVYKVRTENDRGYINQWYQNVLSQGNFQGMGATPVDVSSTNASGINFVLAPGQSISGRVTDASGQPIPNVGINLCDVDGHDLGVGGFWGQTNGDGYYWLGGLVPGVYKVVTWNDQGYLDQWYQDVPCQGHSADEATPIDVSTADATGIDFRLAKILGVALYSGADATLSGSCKVESPLVAGQPSAASYINGKLKTSGSADLSQTVLYVKAKGAAIPPLSQFMPDSLVASLTLASQAAQSTGTTYNGLSYSGSKSVTITQPIIVNGNLTISGSGSYTFDSVYVTGNVTISGSATVSFGSLRVGGTLSVSGSGTSHFGPTYVAGNTTLSGSGHWNGSLLVTSGALTITGSVTIGGDGLGTHAKPVRILVIGANKSITFSGSGTFYGLLYDQSGNFAQSGSGLIRGSVLCGGSYTASGSCDLEYDQGVLDNLN
jgi:hypothetical protein